MSDKQRVWVMICNGQIEGVFSSLEKADEQAASMDDDDFLRTSVYVWDVDGQEVDGQ